MADLAASVLEASLKLAGERHAALTHKDEYEDFGLDLRRAVRDLWAGKIVLGLFGERMTATLEQHLANAWETGLNSCGVDISEMTPEEQGEMEKLIIEQAGYVGGFADSIIENSRAAGGKLTPHINRALLWQNQYNAVYARAQAMACGDQKLRWDLGATEEHCRDCLRYAGRVYRASIWDKYAALPQSHALECGGWLCDCSLNPTDEPAMPGVPPGPVGGRL